MYLRAVTFIYISAILVCCAQASYFSSANYTDSGCQTLKQQKIYPAGVCLESSDSLSLYLRFELTAADIVTRTNCADEECLDCNSTVTYELNKCGSNGEGTLFDYFETFPTVSETTPVETDYNDRGCVGEVLYWIIWGPSAKTCATVPLNNCTLDPDNYGSTWFNCAAMRNESEVPRGTTTTTGGFSTTGATTGAINGSTTTGDLNVTTTTGAATDAPTEAPTNAPTTAPTDAPTTSPTDAPTNPPTNSPTTPPTNSPTDGGQVTGSASSLSISFGLVLLSFFLLQ